MLRVIGPFQYDNLIKTRAFKRDVHLKLREATLSEFQNQLQDSQPEISTKSKEEKQLIENEDSLLEFGDIETLDDDKEIEDQLIFDEVKVLYTMKKEQSLKTNLRRHILINICFLIA